MFDASGDGLPKKVQSVILNKLVLRRRLSRTGFCVSDKIGNREILHRLSDSFTELKLKLVTLLLRNFVLPRSVISLNDLNDLRIIKARSLQTREQPLFTLRSNFHVEFETKNTLSGQFSDSNLVR